MNTSEILDKAADLIEERGHWKGWYCGPHGELCLRGAVITAVDPSIPLRAQEIVSLPRAAYTALRTIGEFLHRTAAALSSAAWNDAPERTPADVVEALRAAARTLR